MNKQRPCERCGRPLSESAAETICPACVAQLGRASWLHDPDELSARTTTALDAPALTESAGTVIGRHKVLEPLGEGGFGVVWVAEQREPFEEDVWVKGVGAKPDNTRVVHHIIVRVREENQTGDDPDDVFLIGWAPGTPQMFFPEGTGKRIRKGSILETEMHYTTSGRPETDQSGIGIYLHKDKPAMQLQTRAAVDFNLEISPASRQATQAIYAFKKDSVLYDLAPHMHVRGAWFKFEALYPGGSQEVLLSVPRYDFNWQHTYRLVEPKRMPAGTWILCTGGFDNSNGNRANPNPRVPVYWGEQSFDEMVIGFNVAEIPTSTSDSQPVASLQ